MTAKGVAGFIGMNIAGGLGWWVGAYFGLWTAFFVSTVGTGFGLWAGRRLAAEYLE
ncbi:MAG: hypothetical protein ABJD07_13830 [Gemmatimonadaceae bacterium]